MAWKAWHVPMLQQTGPEQSCESLAVIGSSTQVGAMRTTVA